jgi:hypothetical protein
VKHEKKYRMELKDYLEIEIIKTYILKKLYIIIVFYFLNVFFTIELPGKFKKNKLDPYKMVDIMLLILYQMLTRVSQKSFLFLV